MNSLARLLFLSIIALTLSSCEDDDTTQPISINFENTVFGLNDGEVTVNVIFSRSTTQDGQLLIKVDAGSLVYGVDQDYYTEPAIIDGVLTLDFVSGNDNLSFVIKEGNALNISEDVSISFTLSTDALNLSIGENITATVSFSENFVTPEATVSANIGGSQRTNQAYIDLSTGTTTSVSKDAYDLILESSGSDFNILLNYASKMMALNTGKSSFSDVSESDLNGVSWQGDLHMDIASGQAISLGDFTETKFYQWDANGSTSNVFIINRGEKDKDGTDRGIKKVQITKSSDSYTIKSADLNGSNQEEHTITKDTDQTFKFVHFEDGEADVEPASWDISVRTASQVAAQDGVYYAAYNTLGAFQNHYGGVQIAVIEADTTEFDDIAKSDAESAITNADSDLNTISFNWRTLNFSTFQYEIIDGITYIIMDADGNYFKLKFTNYYNASNEEEPQFYYEHLR